VAFGDGKRLHAIIKTEAHDRKRLQFEIHMQIRFQIGSRTVRANTARPVAISIQQTFGADQVNHFGVPIAKREPVRQGSFLGSTAVGGSCNVDQITIIPHCNGTHVEHVGHIVDEPPGDPFELIPALMAAALITVQPVDAVASGEVYRPPPQAGDRVVPAAALLSATETIGWRNGEVHALIIRTLPNDDDKRRRRYGEQYPSPYLTVNAVDWLIEQSINHLLVDFPSIDRTHDQGWLTNHHCFWGVPERTHQSTGAKWSPRTITELVYVPSTVADGYYLLNLQFADWRTDAVPARPLLFEIDSNDHSA
jgi:kynurenine formamidase